MIAFYLTINKTAKGGIKLFSSPDGSPTDLGTAGQQALYIFKDDRRQIVQANGSTIFNIGTLIYKNTWRNKALELIMHDLNNGKTIQEIMPDTRGQFCLIVHTGRDVFVNTDKLGSFPVYTFEDNDTIQISNILLLLAKNNDVSINHQALVEYLSFDFCFDSTFFNEVEHLKMATIYQFGSERRAQVYDDVFSNIHLNKYTNLQQVAGMAKETLIHNLSFLSSHDRIFVDVTGGFDTRTVAAILQSRNVDFEAGACGEQVLGESGFAERVAQALSVKFHSDIKIADRYLLKKILDRHFMISAGVPFLYHSSELINYYENIRRDFDIHVMGFGGTELSSQTLPKLGLLSSRVSKKALFRKKYLYRDIFIDSLIAKAQYYENITKKIDRVLQIVRSDLYNEIGNLLSFSEWSRYYAGCAIGTHNVLIPAYSPFLESNYLKLMLETSYDLKEYHNIQRTILTKLNPTVSSIMTTHGYSADIGSRSASSILRRSKNGVKNLTRRVIYQFGLFRIMTFVENMLKKIKPPVNIEEVQRSFWVSEVNEAWSDDMEIFELIDRNKLNKCLANERRPSELKAKILYLNRMINECGARL
ncbi:MAG: hypothetical protein ACYSUB_08805 [Planctomycetota bacterium]|jgi:hypothetical protein